MRNLIKLGEMRSSSSARWLNCPGSTVLAAGEVSESSDFAIDGTAAHALLEYCLAFEASPEDVIGQAFDVEGVAVAITEEISDAVAFALDWLYENDDPTNADFEAKLTGHAIGLPELTGHVDYRRVSGSHLIVVDFKYGAGQVVEAFDNKQLLTYALLSLADSGEPIETVQLVVIQPRGRGELVKLWDCTFADVAEHLKQVSQTSRVVDYLTNNPHEALSRLHGGDHCQFCPAMAKCPTYAEPAGEAALAAFSAEGYFLQLTDAEVAFWYDNATRFRAFLTAVTDIAKTRRDNGGMPGFKFVDSLANRSWKHSDKAIEASLVSLGVDVDKIRKPAQLLGPSPIEKLTPPEGMTRKQYKAELATMTHRPVKGRALVRDSDRRESNEVDPGTMFDEVAT